jgi:two-component system OmpR family response regulator
VRVLVVEDELRMAALLKRGLEEDGYAVDVVNTGTDAVWQANEFSYDAVVLDVMLPGLDGVPGLGGIGVCRRLREAGRWMPVLMLTARDAVEDRVRGLDAGADDYLTKPFSFAELSARIRALIRRGAVERPSELCAADLRLDPATRQAWRGQVELELSTKEFALLELFLRHRGQVLTRTRILEHVWDFAYDGVSNVVDQYVLYLRRKIDRPFGLEQLETVRGAGYRLRTEPATVGSR